MRYSTLNCTILPLLSEKRKGSGGVSAPRTPHFTVREALTTLFLCGISPTLPCASEFTYHLTTPYILPYYFSLSSTPIFSRRGAQNAILEACISAASAGTPAIRGILACENGRTSAFPMTAAPAYARDTAKCCPVWPTFGFSERPLKVVSRRKG